MIRIERLKMKGFKSFKTADILFEDNFVCLAGPNGSGKSNICDAIRFVVGEKSPKNLRISKTLDLIHMDSKKAEVKLYLKDKEDKISYEIKREIREDGTVKYYMNGKTVRRGAIIDELRKHNLDSTGRYIIAQGAVQRIVDMRGKERREIIDGVAGISEFEEKKKEALRELDTVEKRINDANIIVGERKAFLSELEVESKKAVKYKDAKKLRECSKASLIRNEYSFVLAETQSLEKEKENLEEKKEKLSKDKEEILSKIKQEEKKRTLLSNQLGNREERDKLFRSMEETKSQLGKKNQSLEDSRLSKKRVEDDFSSIERDISQETKSISSLKIGIQDLTEKLEPLEKQKISIKEDPCITDKKSKIEILEKEERTLRESLLIMEGEFAKETAILEEIKTGDEEVELPDLGNISKELIELERSKSQYIRDMDKLFIEEKEMNSKLAGCDRNLLSLREKTATLRAQSSKISMTHTLSIIEDLKQNMDGIYGMLAELMEFDAKYSKAVDASGGARLLYIVVEDSKIALEIIKELKSRRAGRATFIPLKEIKTGGREENSLVKYIKFDPMIRKAVDYVFGSTKLVSSSAEARKSIGKARMVTLEGELFERSGIISGGTSRGIASAAQLKRVEVELAETKKQRDTLTEHLRFLREEMSKLRKERNEIELNIKKKELEFNSVKERKKGLEKQLKEDQERRKKKKELQDSILFRNAKKEEMGKRRDLLESELKKQREELNEFIEKISKEKEKSIEESTRLYSSLKAKLEAKSRELEIRMEGIEQKKSKRFKLETEKKELLDKIQSLEKEIKLAKEKLRFTEESIRESGDEWEQLLAKAKEYDKVLQSLGEEKGKLSFKLEDIDKKLGKIEVKDEMLSTRLEDLENELKEFEGVETIKAGKQELLKNIENSKELLTSLGDVNLSAPEMYDVKKKEIDEMVDKIEKLQVEKHAILDMISGIEERKKAAFFEAFEAVEENFRKLFQHINVGEGELYLSDPENLFESGLHIKIKRDNREHALELLSGGEKTLLALMFSFAIQFYKPSPFYILDEVDASLDKANSRHLSQLLNQLSQSSQFIVVSHDDTIMSSAQAVYGVTRVDNISKIVGIKLKPKGA